MSKNVPQEFSQEYVIANSTLDSRMYRDQVQNREPMQSVLRNNPEIYFVPPKRQSEWGQWEYKEGSYYDTTTGSKHPYWKDIDLPKPTKDINRLRNDLVTWGFCYIEDAVSKEVVQKIRQRVMEQAEGERLAGIAQRTPSGQNINCCINKGQCFEGLIEMSPDVVQGYRVVEQLVTECLGSGWITTSLIGAMSMKGGVPQALHQDQGGIHPGSFSPMSLNVLTAVTDVDERNGGTLVIPGSHTILSEAVRAGREVGKLPPAINVNCKAGTMYITDGRLLHGTGINRTETPRIVMLNGVQKNWMRQQENWMVSVKPSVLERASPKLLQRMGYQATTGGQTTEGHGFGAVGRINEAAGALRDFRIAQDRGQYIRVGELGPNSTEEELNKAFTLRDVVAKARRGGKAAPVGIGSLGLRQNKL